MSFLDRGAKPKAPLPLPKNGNGNNVTPMPSAGNIPGAPQRAAPVEQAYAEEALRAAQRAIDQIREIERLSDALDTMERRALLAESNVSRLEQRERVLTEHLETRTNLLMEERDMYRFRLNNLQAQFEAAGSIILQCMDAAKAEVASRVGVNLNRMAREIENVPLPRQPQETQLQETSLPLDDPMPKVVMRGPAVSDDEKKPEQQAS